MRMRLHGKYIGTKLLKEKSKMKERKLTVANIKPGRKNKYFIVKKI